MAAIHGFAPELTVPKELWSPDNQRDWAAGFPTNDIEAAMSPLNPPPRVLSKTMLQLVEQAMERLLGFIKAELPSQLQLPLRAHYNRETITKFKDHLQKTVSKRTQIDYLTRLKIAGFRLAPASDLAWLALLINDIDYVIPTPESLPATTYQLYQAGVDTMEAALVSLNDWRREHGIGHYQPNAVVAYRDGLLVAMLALIAARIASMLDIGLKRNFAIRTRTSNYGIVIVDRKSPTKPSKLRDIPEELTPYIDIYLDQIRPLFTGAETSETFWIVAGGGSLTYQGAFGSFKRTVSRRLDIKLSPHKARHLLADAMRGAGSSDTDISEALGHLSPGSAPKHYISAPKLGARALLARISGV